MTSVHRAPRPFRPAALTAAGLAVCALLATTTVALPAGAVTGVLDPLTGVRVVSTGAVVAIKVANTPQARPQSGLRSADQIWVEEQEGGWTRFIAIYGSAYPGKVGPCRAIAYAIASCLACCQAFFWRCCWLRRRVTP